ncbi:MAG: Fe-S cluster assembly protein SufD [Candidatus Marinimicrobia bacterium]|nr:Fe-S cluster assembly protein SufD [Candidatus Neomarinimicrobiota bacterium]
MSETVNNFKNWIQDQVYSDSDQSFTLSSELRQPSLAVLDSGDFPTRKDEEWRNTPLHNLFSRTLEPATKDQVNLPLLEKLKQAVPKALQLVFVNGVFASELSVDLSSEVPAGLKIKLMSTLDPEARQRAEKSIRNAKLTDDNIFHHITLGLSHSGLFIELAGNVEIEKPLHILYLSSANNSASFSNPLHVIRIGQNSRLKIIQQFASTAGVKAVTVPSDIIQLQEGAGLDLVKIGLESEETDHVSNTAVEIAGSAILKAHQYLLGSRLTRSNLEVTFAGPGATADLRGLYLGDGSQHLDIRTYMDHAHPHCRSDQHFRGIMNDNSRGVFNGMVLVREHAQQTDAQQSNKNLLLSRDARVDTKPQLEIFADDVKCTHGATVGELDDDALFYLQSRGISRTDAVLMLTRAFSVEITQDIQIETLRGYVEEEIARRLDRIGSDHV